MDSTNIRTTPRGRLLVLSIVAALLAVPGASALKSSYDVVVIGSQPEAIAAAVAAAREGASTLLVTESTSLGGFWTQSWVLPVDVRPVNGQLVQRGLFEEFMDAGSSGPGLWRRGLDATTMRAYFAKLVSSTPNLDSALGVSWPSDYFTKSRNSAGNYVVSRIDFNYLGKRQSVAARTVVDGTSEATAAAEFGAQFLKGRQHFNPKDTRTQAISLAVLVEGINWNALYPARKKTPFKAGSRTLNWDNSDGQTYGKIPFEDFYTRFVKLENGIGDHADVAMQRSGDAMVIENSLHLFGFDATDPDQYAEAKELGEHYGRQLCDYLDGELDGTPVKGFENAACTTAPALYVRETRHLVGIRTLSAADVFCGRFPADSIALGSYPIDIHGASKQEVLSNKYSPEVVAEFGKAGEVCSRRTPISPYGIPFSIMVPKGFDNVLVAGKAASADHIAAGSLRVLSQTIVMGQAAGIAAAMAAKDNAGFQSFAANGNKILALQGQIKKRGGVPNANS